MQADQSGGSASDSGRKRAGSWLNTDIDLDQYRNTKRYKGQEIACDLGGLHLAGAGGAGPASAGATSTGPSPDPPESPMVSSDMMGSPMRQTQSQGWQPGAQAMQCTPRSESRTPSVHGVHGGGGGGGAGGAQPSVHSSGQRSRLAVGHTPVRLSDALNLQQVHPTSPSDPGLEGQLDLRKATLMRRLQTRLLQTGGDELPAASPAGSLAAAVAGGPAAALEREQPFRGRQQPRRRQHQQHGEQQQPAALLHNQAQHAQHAASTAGPGGMPGQAAAAGSAALYGSNAAPAALVAGSITPAAGSHVPGGALAREACPDSLQALHAFATPSGQQQQQHCPSPGTAEAESGCSSAMQISPAAPRVRAL